LGKTKTRYDDLPNMSLEEIEEEINFFTFLDNLPNLDISDKMAMKNKIWLDSLWIEVKRRDYEWELKVKLNKKSSETG
jgi:hypothetical protein|tara:strand:+ start:355 stop:588 length:234 start_codon:yes stop_codon:yes gene_type:complete